MGGAFGDIDFTGLELTSGLDGLGFTYNSRLSPIPQDAPLSAIDWFRQHDGRTVGSMDAPYQSSGLQSLFPGTDSPRLPVDNTMRPFGESESAGYDQQMLLDSGAPSIPGATQFAAQAEATMLTPVITDKTSVSSQSTSF
ncbi:hypothetical protein LTR78_008919 [Recurvomyces mirabilis]|uniref:Uncharacterized protein n=1 Tax=Recurvomyces mirabilis TaxID=574656 RepID=A0AAE0TT09_9PEZI|nr:hypothetical protein LTR78_008919 [Recurvomyces mirabilis]